MKAPESYLFQPIKSVFADVFCRVGLVCEFFSKIISVLMRPNPKPLNVTLKEYLSESLILRWMGADRECL